MKKKGDPIDGVLLFDKPEGLSSNAAMQIVRRLANAQKAGHTGTLDPSSEQKPIRGIARAPSHRRSMRRV